MKIYITHLLEILNFSSLFRRFEIKNVLFRPTMMADNISNLVAPPRRIFFISTGLNIAQKIGQKIQVKAKFLQAVITNIRTLLLVFLKMFWTAVWRKTPGSCFWHYLCKTIYLRSRKIALTVFTEMCSTPFFMEIKMLL